MIILNLNQRIIELENIIKKKDKQIAKLKEKLAKSISFDYIYSRNGYESDDEDENKIYKDLELNIIYHPHKKSEEKFEFKEYCNLNERIRSLKKRIYKKISEKFNVKFCYLQFLFNCYPLSDKLLVSHTGLTNGSNIMIIDNSNIRGAGNNNENENDKLAKDDNEDIHLIFQTIDGDSINIYTYRGIPIGILLIFYFLIVDKFYELLDFINGSKTITFLFNGCLLNIKDGKSVGEIIGDVINPKIIVNDVHALIGG